MSLCVEAFSPAHSKKMRLGFRKPYFLGEGKRGLTLSIIYTVKM